MELQTKFSIGQKAWIMRSNKTMQVEIYSIHVWPKTDDKSLGISYILIEDESEFSEDKIFATKAELLASL